MGPEEGSDDILLRFSCQPADHPQHLQLIFGIKPITAFDFHGGGAELQGYLGTLRVPSYSSSSVASATARTEDKIPPP